MSGTELYPSSFTGRVGKGARREGAVPTLPADWNKRVTTTQVIAAGYALCNVMYGTKACSCQKRSTMPCDHMATGVAVVARNLGAP